jgi:hypothetical protein
MYFQQHSVTEFIIKEEILVLDNHTHLHLGYGDVYIDASSVR